MEVILSAAMSLDGFLDDCSPERLKISSPGDWREVVELRAGCDAILVGANTIRRDNPSLTIRESQLVERRISLGLPAQPVKVTVTRSGDLSPGSDFFRQGDGDKIVFTSGCLPDVSLYNNTEFIPSANITSRYIVEQLASRGYRKLLVEGGTAILTMFLQEGTFNQFRLAVTPFFVGDQNAPRLVHQGRFLWNKDNPLDVVDVKNIDGTVVINLRPGK